MKNSTTRQALARNESRRFVVIASHSHDSTRREHRGTLRAQLEKKNMKPLCAGALLHRHLNTRKSCQVMSDSLSQVGISCHSEVMSRMFPYLTLSIHHIDTWHNRLDARHIDIYALLFYFCPPLKGLIIRNATPMNNTTRLDPFTTTSDNLDNRIAIHQRGLYLPFVLSAGGID